MDDRIEHDRRAARRALARWADFPATADPRPIVLLDGATRPDRGFSTGDAKLAFLVGAVEGAAGVPAEPVQLMQVTHTRGPAPEKPLRVTGAVLAEAWFSTDQGRQVLPAWRVEAEDTLGPIWVATEEACRRSWTPPPNSEERGPHTLTRATLDPDGHGLTVEFTGGHETHLSYDAEVLETAGAVIVIPVEHQVAGFPPNTIVTAQGFPREVRVRLDRPLGGRVLVNLDGTLVEVTRP